MIARPILDKKVSSGLAVPKSQNQAPTAGDDGLPRRQVLWQTRPPMDLAPLCVPVEISAMKGELRCFRLAVGVSESGLRLRSPLPEELQGPPLRIRLTLPPPTGELARLFASEWDGGLRLLARAASEVVAPNTSSERRLWRLLVFQKPEPEMLEKLTRYVTMRTEED